MKLRSKVQAVWRHRITGEFYRILGAKITSTETRCFVVCTDTNARERLFPALPECWDAHPDEIETAFITLLNNETRRERNKKARMKKEAAVSDEDRDSWVDSRVLTPLLDHVEIEESAVEKTEISEFAEAD